MNFSPDGKLFVVGGVVRETKTGAILGELKKDEPRFGFSSLAISPDSTTLALGDRDGHIRLLLGATEKFAICCLNTKNANGVVEFFDFASRQSLGTLVPHQTSGIELASSRDGRFLATTGRISGIGDYVVRIWNTTELLGKLFQGLPPRHGE